MKPSQVDTNRILVVSEQSYLYNIILRNMRMPFLITWKNNTLYVLNIANILYGIVQRSYENMYDPSIHFKL